MAPYLDIPTPPAEDDNAQEWPTKALATSATRVKNGDVAIGGNDTWTYSPHTGLFDLSRGSGRVLTLHSSPDEVLVHHHAGVKVDPEKTCLIIVDMQNYFIHPSFHRHSAGLAAVTPIMRAIQKCRAHSIQVAWLNWVINDQDMYDMPPAVQRCFNAQRVLERGHGWGVNLGSPVLEQQGGGRVLWEGSWNADIYGPLKALACPTDVVCHKNRMSGMWHPAESLHRFLLEGGFKTLLFAGINTDMCLLSTMTDAYSSGFDVVMLRDCTGTATRVRGAQELVEHNVASCMGFVFDNAAFVGAKEHQEPPEFMRCDSGVGMMA